MPLRHRGDYLQLDRNRRGEAVDFERRAGGVGLSRTREVFDVNGDRWTADFTWDVTNGTMGVISASGSAIIMGKEACCHGRSY